MSFCVHSNEKIINSYKSHTDITHCSISIKLFQTFTDYYHNLDPQKSVFLKLELLS